MSTATAHWVAEHDSTHHDHDLFGYRCEGSCDRRICQECSPPADPDNMLCEDCVAQQEGTAMTATQQIAFEWPAEPAAPAADNALTFERWIDTPDAAAVIFECETYESDPAPDYSRWITDVFNRHNIKRSWRGEFRSELMAAKRQNDRDQAEWEQDQR